MAKTVRIPRTPATPSTQPPVEDGGSVVVGKTDVVPGLRSELSMVVGVLAALPADAAEVRKPWDTRADDLRNTLDALTA